MSDRLMRLARGRRCTIRLPGCDGGGDTTVGCHFRSLRLGAGMALKSNDLMIAFGCWSCHEATDGRRFIDGYTKTDIRFAHAVGVLQTICALTEEGVIVIKGKREIV